MDLTQLIENTHYEHSRNVARLSRLLAKRAGYPDKEARIIEQAALYHDVGKTGIAPDILNKPGRLTPGEFEVIKTHTAIGWDQINSAAEILSVAARTAREHHERLDGGGYLGLAGSEIHPYSKLIALADVFDALRSKRAYKEAWSIGDITAYFHAQAGKHFDRQLVTLFLGIMDEVSLLYADTPQEAAVTV